MAMLKIRTASSKAGLKNRNLTKKEKEAEASFKTLMAKWDKVEKFAGKYPSSPTKNTAGIASNASRIHGKESDTASSSQVSTKTKPKFDVGSTAPRKTIQYTGDAMLGVAGMHKSCDVPVFSKEAAEDVAKMRRN